MSHGNGSQAGDSSNPEPRAKRAKYALAACVQCKRRKTKCVRADHSLRCERCLSFGEDCTFPDGHIPMPTILDTDGRFDKIEAEFAQLQRQVHALQRERHASRNHPVDRAPVATYPNAPAPPRSRRRPHFVGRTRPAFSFDIAGDSLRDRGVSAGMPSFSRDDTPDASTTSKDMRPDGVHDPLLSMSKHEALQHINLFLEEVYPVYPFVNIPAMNRQVESVFGSPQGVPPQHAQTSHSLHDDTDTLALKVVIAIGIVMEAMGATTLSQHLVETVEAEIFGLRIISDAYYTEAIATALLGIYYFHTDQELLAWRVNGIAARMMLELGLHRHDVLAKTFSDPDERMWATRLFWCIYVLDRRWSFGTSLPFAVQDADIDPELPELDDPLGYLQCMIQYGRICSQIWQAFPSFGALGKTIPEDTVSYLEFKIQSWIESIPQHLRRDHLPSDYEGDEAHGRITLRLATQLYLRGNHAQIMINRHALLSQINIRTYARKAQRVVDLAKDSVRALVQLNGSSNVYMRQQVAFNYFLVSSLAVIFLAVCQDPSTYGPQCQETFHTAVDLLRVFSTQNLASKRLWKNIRTLVPEMQKLGLGHTASNAPDRRTSMVWDNISVSGRAQSSGQQESINGHQQTPLTPTSSALPNSRFQQQSLGSPRTFNEGSGQWDPNLADASMFGSDQMTHELNSWYDCFGTADGIDGMGSGTGLNMEGNTGYSVDLSQLFGDLI